VRVPAAGLPKIVNEKALFSAATENQGFMRRWGLVASAVTDRHTANIVPGQVGRRITGCDLKPP